MTRLERSPPFEPIGTRDIISTPAETTTSSCPAATAAAALKFVCIDEPHCRSTVVPADLDRPAGGQHGHPADVPALLADLRDAAHLHVVDPARIEADPVDQPVQHLRREVVAAQRRERSVLGVRSASARRRRCTRPLSSTVDGHPRLLVVGEDRRVKASGRGSGRIDGVAPSISSRIEWVTSPPSTTRPSSDSTTTDWWPGEWPGVESTDTPSKSSRRPSSSTYARSREAHPFLEVVRRDRSGELDALHVRRRSGEPAVAAAVVEVQVRVDHRDDARPRRATGAGRAPTPRSSSGVESTMPVSTRIVPVGMADRPAVAPARAPPPP